MDQKPNIPKAQKFDLRLANGFGIKDIVGKTYATEEQIVEKVLAFVRIQCDEDNWQKNSTVEVIHKKERVRGKVVNIALEDDYIELNFSGNPSAAKVWNRVYEIESIGNDKVRLIKE